MFEKCFIQERVPDPGPDQQIRLRRGGGGRGQEPEDLQPRAGAGQARMVTGSLIYP